MFTAVLAAVILSSIVNGQDTPGPQNITRTEGANDVLIQCPFLAPIWRINSSLYEPLGLEYPFLPSLTGLKISVVDISLNRTSFQCFTPTGTELFVHVSSVGILNVAKKGMLQYKTALMNR